MEPSWVGGQGYFQFAEEPLCVRAWGGGEDLHSRAEDTGLCDLTGEGESLGSLTVCPQGTAHSPVYTEPGRGPAMGTFSKYCLNQSLGSEGQFHVAGDT